MKTFLLYILARLKERSSWMGIISAAAAFGILISPEQQEAIVAAGVAIAGVITMLTKDKQP